MSNGVKTKDNFMSQNPLPPSKQSSMRGFTAKLEQFWAEESADMLTSFNRNRYFSSLLLFLLEFQILNYNFNTYNSDLTVTKDQSSRSYMRFIIIDNWPETFILGFYLFATAVNYILTFYLLVKFIAYCKGIHINNYPAISLLFKVYNYVVFQPAIYCNLFYYSSSPTLAIISFPISFSLMMLTAHIDYDIRYSTKDFLARREYRYEAWLGFLQAFAVYEVRAGEWSFSLSWFALFYQSIQVYIHYFRHPYCNPESQRIRFSLCFTNLMITLSQIFLMFLNNPRVDFILLLLINLPVSIYAGHAIIALKQKGLLSKCIKIQRTSNYHSTTTTTSTLQNSKVNFEANLRELDLFFRILYSSVDCSLKQYLSSNISIVLEQLITDHHISCTKYPNCFCEPNVNNDSGLITKENFVGESARKQYLEEFILSSFKLELQNPKAQLTPFHFSYFMFLTNALRCEFISLREIMKLKESVYEKSPTHIKQTINLMYSVASSEFELRAKKIQLQAQTKIQDILDFDETLTASIESIQELLRMKTCFLDMMKADSLNIQQLQNYAKILYVKRESLKQNLVHLYNQNASSPYLSALCQAFKDCLTIDDPFTAASSSRQKGHVFTSFKSSNNNKKLKRSIRLYSEASATVFVSLLSRVGHIKKVSRNFGKVTDFCKNPSDLIGKNISTVMSEELASVHDEIFLNNLSKKDVNYSVRDFPILIAKNSEGWSYPITAKTQITLIGINELGACATIQPIHDGNSYILTSDTSQELQIQIMSQYIFQILFSSFSKQPHKQIDQANIRKIKLARLAPLLTEIIKESPNTLLETLIIQPTSMEDALIQRNPTCPSFISSLLSRNLFTIKFTVYPIHNPIISINQFQIMSLQPLRNTQQKKEAIHNFMAQLSHFHDITAIKKQFSYLFSSLNQLELKQKSQNELLSPNPKKSPQLQALKCLEASPQLTPQNQLVNSSSTSISKEFTYDLNSHRNEGNNSSPNNQSNTLNSYFLKDSVISTAPQMRSIENQNGPTILSRYAKTQQISQAALASAAPSPAIDHIITEGNSYDSKNDRSQLSIDKIRNNILFSESIGSSPVLSPIYQVDSSNRMIQLLSPSPIPTDHAIIENDQFRILSLQSPRSMNEKLDLALVKEEEQFMKIEFNENNQEDSEFSDDYQVKQNLKSFYNINLKADDSSSVNSNASNNNQLKKQRILKVIRSNRLSTGLRIIQIIGVLSIILIAIANLVSFFVLYSDQNSQKINFENFFWCFQVKRYISLVLGIHQAYQSVIFNHYMFQTPADKKIFLYMLTKNKDYIYEGFKNLTMQLVNSNEYDVFIFNQAWNYPIDLYFSKIMDYTQVSTPSTLTLSVMYWYVSSYYVLQNNDLMWYNFHAAYQNQDAVVEALSIINKQNVENIIDNIENSKLLIQSMLIAIVLLSSIFSMLIIPIYAFNQTKREDILKLFATIPAARIQKMLACVAQHTAQIERLERIRLKQQTTTSAIQCQAANTLLYRKQKIRERVKEKRGDSEKKSISNQMKRKNVSSTTSLVRFNWKFIPFLLVCLLVTLVNPIATYVIYQRQFSNFQAGITLQDSLESFFENITQLLSLKYQVTFIKIQLPMAKQIEDFMRKVNSKRAVSESLLNDLINQESIYEENPNIFNRDSYVNYLFPIFKGNICETIGNSNRNLREVVIKIPRCKMLFEGVFTKGLIAASKASIDYVETFYEAANMNDPDYFKSVFESLQKRLNIREEFETFQLILLLTRVIQYFFRDEYDIYHAYIIELSFLFLCVQVVLLAAVLIFGWRRFYVLICTQLFTTKQLIDLIDIETLLDNSYVTSYFLKNNYLKN